MTDTIETRPVLTGELLCTIGSRPVLAGEPLCTISPRPVLFSKKLRSPPPRFFYFSGKMSSKDTEKDTSSLFFSSPSVIVTPSTSHLTQVHPTFVDPSGDSSPSVLNATIAETPRRTK